MNEKFNITCSKCFVTFSGRYRHAIDKAFFAHDMDVHQVSEKITKQRFVNITTKLIEKYFPKGETEMRGEALVLIADMLIFLMEAGVVEEYEP